MIAQDEPIDKWWGMWMWNWWRRDIPKWVKNRNSNIYQIEHATSTACRLELNVWLICGVNCSSRVLANHQSTYTDAYIHITHTHEKPMLDFPIFHARFAMNQTNTRNSHNGKARFECDVKLNFGGCALVATLNFYAHPLAHSHPSWIPVLVQI